MEKLLRDAASSNVNVTNQILRSGFRFAEDLSDVHSNYTEDADNRAAEKPERNHDGSEARQNVIRMEQLFENQLARIQQREEGDNQAGNENNRKRVARE
jgi:hypothetical protein